MTIITDTTPKRASPYLGLDSYSENDYAYFFGRGREITTVVANLAVARLTLFYGPSGVGKTSVLRAGAMHRLQERVRKNLTNSGRPGVIPIYFNRWHQDPLADLTQAIGDAIERFVTPVNLSISNSQEFVKQLQEWVQEYNSDLLIIFDQFEEYFFYSKNAGADEFADALIQTVNSPSLRINFLLSLREDGLARLDRFKGRIPFLLDNRLTIRQLTRNNAQEAIEKPLEYYSKETGHTYTIQEELTKTILDQLSDSPIKPARDGQGAINQEKDAIEAPYLQLVLSRLWTEEIKANSTILRLSTLAKLGDTKAIAMNYVDNSMMQLSDEYQTMAARFIDRLVTPSGTKIALTLDDLNKYIRDPQDESARSDDNSASTDEEEEDKKQLESLLQILLQRRILQDVPSTQGQIHYQITHDVLGPALLDWRDRYQAHNAKAKRADRILEKATGVTDLHARRQLLEEALELVPEHAHAQKELKSLRNEEQITHLYAAAVTYMKNEKWRDAQRVLERVEQLIPNFRDTRSRLAAISGKLSTVLPSTPLSLERLTDATQIQIRPILEALLEGRLVPFLGNEIGIGRSAQDRWVKGLYPPSDPEAAIELARFLPIQLSVESSLLQVSQYIALYDGDFALYDRLASLYSADFVPTMLHRLLAELPQRLAAKGYPKISGRRYVLFSTAFDELLERAFEEVGQPYHLFAYRPRFVDDEGVVQTERFLHYLPAGNGADEPIEVLEPNKYTAHDDDNHPILIKPRGRRVTSDPDSVAVTEDHYLNYISTEKSLAVLPTTLLTLLRRHSFLFFGHSLQPWHLRLLWQRLRLLGGERQPPRWAIVPVLTHIEESFWRSQRIEPIVAQPEGVVAYVNDWLEQL